LAKSGLKLLPLIFLLSACSSSTAPSFLKEDTASAVRDICKKEYKLELVTKLAGRTLWVYLPMEDIITKPAKPEKYTEKFSIDQRESTIENRILKVSYSIRPVTDKEIDQETALDKKVNENLFNIIGVIRRVLFSVDQARADSPLFFSIVIADIKNSFAVKYVFCLTDIKKYSYGLLSQTEWQHRVVQETQASALILGDRIGSHLDYQDITMDEFVTNQIKNRINIKFQKPEVEKNADIDKEILKIISCTTKAYDFRNFSLLEMTNLINNQKTTLDCVAVLDNAKD